MEMMEAARLEAASFMLPIPLALAASRPLEYNSTERVALSLPPIL